MIEVLTALTPEDIEAVRFLVLAHAAALREHPGSEGVRSDAEQLPGPYTPPRGRLYLARFEGIPAGCVALRALEGAIGEVKRMFVLATVRRNGVARALMERLLADARQMGYETLRLGTLSEMTAAQQLYRELGFVEISRYPTGDQMDTVFFERTMRAR
ncbi:MAG: GNAT family N-acetyltransferase [Gemmatimonadales bacterium]|nr:GNAT family N-acetyltransferase [Gemmatimonadales bacterium]